MSNPNENDKQPDTTPCRTIAASWNAPEKSSRLLVQQCGGLSRQKIKSASFVERELNGVRLTLQLPFCFEVGSLSGSLVSSAPE